MLRGPPRILFPLEILKWASALLGFNKRVTRSFVFIGACGHFSPSPVPLRGLDFLDARFRLVSSPQTWGRTDCAREVHTSDRRLAMDPFFAEFWLSAGYRSRI